ncbi:UDP-glucuronosyltransferase 2a1-like [Plakobranchus ocellatus]|uniref:UDP-glucuronosyltransferase 2a1-like n=1 Tax=Plakobranchus ocellatus TaxID=259542 RepID=A0AAV4DSZ2_9GAST|nr:UDP-glucuronosyltransferase 2a1-like [Plakobranchus ocellatus]
MQGTVNGDRRRGRQKKRWEDNIREWIGLELRNTLRKAEDREEWKAVVGRSSAAPRRIPNLRDSDQRACQDEAPTAICTFGDTTPPPPIQPFAKRQPCEQRCLHPLPPTGLPGYPPKAESTLEAAVHVSNNTCLETI